jgi:hypothetical protein
VTGVQRIDEERSAAALAGLLNGNSRKRPVVVVTIPAGRAEPWIDVEEIAREAGNLAEVYLMPTGSFTWEFSHRMAEGTQVYGGAGRVYPVGHEWATDLTMSPLRFAFNADDGERATRQLISDTLRMAASAGLLQKHPTRELRRVSGEVKMIVAGRALVDVGTGMPAAIAEELTVEDVPIERLVAVGQRIEGWYDSDTDRIDVTKSLRPASEALASYSVGDVAFAKVAMVRNGKANLVLYPNTTTPSVIVPVLRADVTTNPLDDLRSLMTVGEVITARVVSTEPEWALLLHDVDDDEPVVDAPSLLPGGPPWLVEEPEELEVEERPLAPPTPLPMPAADAPVVAAQRVVEPLAPAPARPSPAMLDKSRPRPARSPAPAPAAVQPAASTRSLLLKIDGLTAEVRGLMRDQDNLRTQLLAGADERGQLRYLLDHAERRANRAEHDLKATRARLRKAGSTKFGHVSEEGPRFADPEQGFRYLVTTRWATRTLPSEQAGRPLPEYVIGPHFLPSLDKLEGVNADKVADVVFEIVTGLAPQILGREVHRLRAGSGGDDPIRTREDGATAWRASLQVRTPAARRINYWALPNGQIELARVATHDDFSL